MILKARLSIDVIAGFPALKIIAILLLFICCFSCDSEDAPDCIQTTGNRIEQEVEVPFFDKLIVNSRIGMVISQGREQRVVVSTGENLLEEIEFNVENGVLEIQDQNTCNLLRDYAATTIYITVQDLKEIRSSTGIDMRSKGVLEFSSLRLLSTDGPEEDFYNSNGDFRLELDVDCLYIETTNLSNFYLSGNADFAELNWLNGDGSLLAPELVIKDATIFHRGTNDWQIQVTDRLDGIINGYGDVVLPYAPFAVSVEETWRGRLIIQ